MTAGLLLAAAWLVAAPATLVVSVGGPAEDPAFLPVHAAAALGTFAAEGLTATLRRAKHPSDAVAALRAGEASVAVTTLDQAVRGAAARGTPVRVVVTHTRAPAAALLVAARHREAVRRVDDLRGQRVGIPGPGTTAHQVLEALLQARRIEPSDVELRSFGGAALVSRLGTGELAAAVLEEPWVSRAVATGGAVILLDLRRPDETVRHLGGPFYEVASVTRAGDKDLAPLEAALTAYARALVRVQAWLAATPAAEVAARLPPEVVRDPARFVARLEPLQAAYAPDGDATETGLATTIRILRGGSPLPAGLKLTSETLRPPAFVTAARAALGAHPPAP